MALTWPLGRVLEIDLTRRESRLNVLDEQEVLDWLGGRGLLAKMLSERLNSGLDYYAPENPLIFTVGPLTGTRSPSGGRYALGTLSPMTGGYGMAFAGGPFGLAISWSGLHAIVVTGASPDPLALAIEGEKVAFHDASHLWGKDTFETQDRLKEELNDPKAEISCIGPAGENLVRFAAVISDRRAAARCGVGAVMGSKKLKAIALTHVPKPEMKTARPEDFDAAVKDSFRALAKHPFSKSFRDLGSSLTISVVQESGILPTRNFQEGVFEGADRISGQRLKEEFRVRRPASCYRCPINCESEVRVDSGEYAGAHTRGLEYETLFALGSNCGNDSLESIIFMDMYCDKMGIDTMSLGVTISFAMECFNKGLITKEDTGGLDLSWGNHGLFKKLTDLIVAKEGFGAVLAEGAALASQKIKGAENLAMHVKGLEMGGYDPRGAKGQGLSFATSPRGGCHHAGGYAIGPEVLAGVVDRFTTEGKAALVKGVRNSRIIYDCSILCTFTSLALGWEFPARLLSAVLGVDFSEEELQAKADRIAGLEREINLRFGLDRSDDTLPQRFLKEPLLTGPSAGQVVELDEMLDEFYTLNGWDRG